MKSKGDEKKIYDHITVESKWQAEWDRVKLNTIDLAHRTGKNAPFYNLMMFPYPSAEGLHVGNMYAFTGSDIYGRYKRMQGHDVFEPIGLDGFGIHSENYALKIGRHPMDHAKVTQQHFYEQLHKIGAMFDWSRTLETYDPEYYRWTQWLFTQMFKRGLAYRGKASVNWCPSCKTVLADEQVIDGKCERCGNTVEKRLLEQWFFKITAYAEKLLENSFTLDWSEKVRVAQQNWIGKKEGIEITYPVVNGAETVGEVVCFTTRPDTNFGATFVVIAPEHPFISQILRVIKNEQAVKITKYVETTKNTSEQDRIAQGRKKTGVFTGLYCINNLNGKKMPLYISDFVLMGFGTGAVVGVPGHDTRDFEFARVFNIPVVRVVAGIDGDASEITSLEQVQEDEGKMVNSEFLNGLEIHEATQVIMDFLEKKKWGKRVETYHLRDWLISRQRYWGPPIPMIYCEKCAAKGESWFTMKRERDGSVDNFEMPAEGARASARDRAARKIDNATTARSDGMRGWYPVPDSDLPVLLPRIEDYKPGDDGIAPLAKHKEFYETTCPGCGVLARRETDVSDTFLDSSWYFLRYPSLQKAAFVNENFDASSISLADKAQPISTGQSRSQGEAAQNFVPSSRSLPFDPTITKSWLPVHMYTGGAEHSVLHLMYSRFVTLALHDWGYIDFPEPFAKFFAHGLVIKDGAKMSKSKGNVVNPDEYIRLYGADALRLYLMFIGPYDQGGDFRDSAMEGMRRWVNRVWKLGMDTLNQLDNTDVSLHSRLQSLIKKVTDDVEKRRYNTAIASMMEFTNAVADAKGPLSRGDFKVFLLLLAPFAPHFTEELWQQFGKKGMYTAAGSIHCHPWPLYDGTAVKQASVQMIVQMNGKVRETFEMSQEESLLREKVEGKARNSIKVKGYLEGKNVQKVIFVPGKIINFVAS